MTSRHLLPAVPVAFDHDGALDLDGTRAILEFTAASGNEGAFVLGTTGEFPALTAAERGAVTAASVAALSPHMRVIVHVGAASLWQTLALIAQAREAGAREVSVITPYYLPASDAVLREYFTAVSAAADGLAVYAYVYRARTGNFVDAALLGELARLPNLVGAKVSEEPLEQFAAYRETVPEDFVLYTGSDRDAVRATEAGAQGAVSGCASAFPKPFRELAAAYDAGDGARIGAAQAAVDDVVDVIGGDLARIKASLSVQGVAAGATRMPQARPSEAALEEIRRLAGRYA